MLKTKGGGLAQKLPGRNASSQMARKVVSRMKTDIMKVQEDYKMHKRANRLIAGLLAVMMIVGLLPANVLAAKPDLTISSLSDFQKFAADVNAGNTFEGQKVLLASDLSLGGSSGTWTPIGTETNPFKGTFDGGKHIISGLYVETADAKTCAGLFGVVTKGTIENLIVQGSVSGKESVGGIVGKLNDGTVMNCGNHANVTGDRMVGGVVGNVNGASTISGCYNSGNITGTTGYIGGVTGQHWRAGNVENCYNVGTVKGPATVGGVTGGHKASSPKLINCYNAGSVIDASGSNNNIGAIIGASRGTLTNCYYLKGTGTNTKAGATEVDALKASMLGSAFAEDADYINNGQPILAWQVKVPDLIISTHEELKKFAESVNGGETYEGKLVRLDANISMGGANLPWSPIGSAKNAFKGTFDGNHHVISNLYVDSTDYAGFFGHVNGGTVKNLVVQGSVNGRSNAAGVVGYLTAGKVINCGNEANVNGGSAVAGVVGYVSGDSVINGCYNSGNITATTGYVGGVTGQHWRAGKVENCYNVGAVKGPATVGGVSGGHKASSPVLINCYNAGSVTDSTGSNNNIGAVVGASRGTLTNCYYLKGTGTNTKAGAAEVEVLKASMLSEAFADGETHPVLTWEASISTEKPVRPAFTEGTQLSAQLAEYIKAAVNSAKEKFGLAPTESLLGNPDYMAGASSTATDWMALAMGRFGYFDSEDGTYHYLIEDGTGYEDYLAAMKTYIEDAYVKGNGSLSDVKATEWHRAVVAITALGGDPTNFGTYNGKPINLIADGSYNCVVKKGPGTQGINGWIWGLIAMDAGAYEVPADAKYSRETFITEILKLQLTDGVNGNEYGGWVLGGYGTKSDVDITAMAIQSLAPYYNDDTVYTYTNANSKKEVSKTVRQCVDEALDCLAAKMNNNGGFSSWNTDNVESISQVVVAMCSVGINPAKDERFITSTGKTLLDGILQFRLPNGGFCHVLNSGWNSMANDQATYALVAYWRLENGMRSLYDTRGDWTKEEKTAIDLATQAIDSLPEPASADYKSMLKQALSVFRAVPQSERRYVHNYSQLAAAIELVGGESALDTNAPYITSISITKAPDTLKYYVGETFDPKGMVVTAMYSDGTTKEITDYKISVSGELDTSIHTVFVYYGIVKASVEITVCEVMPWAGEGTELDPYLIETADDLVDLRYYIYAKDFNTEGVYFKMTQDINMKNIEDWRAIADNVRAGFRGHFDGAGYSIWNMNGHVYNACALFGVLGDGAVIENLTIASGSIGGSSNYSVAGIAGRIAENATVTIRSCHNYADISGSFGVGGIVGSVERGAHVIIEDCSNHGTIIASNQGGGIIGSVGPNRGKDSGAYATIRNCYNTGSISGLGRWGNGGIIGSHRTSGANVVTTIQNCYNSGIVTGEVSGAVIGSVCETVVKLENVYYLDASNAKVNGIFTDDGKDTAGTITGTAEAKTEAEMKATSFVGALGSAFAADSDNMNGGYPILDGQKPLGTECPVHAGLEIGTAEELVEFANRVNAGESFVDKTVVLTAHIDLSNVPNWMPIGYYSKYQFNGFFDGQGYVIDNLYSQKGGLFGYVGHKGVIKNVGVASGEIGSKDSSVGSFKGVIAGWSNGTDFINCWSGADIYCGGYSGGLIGTIRDGGKSTVSGCYFIGNVYSSGISVGGIIGHIATGYAHGGTAVEVTVENCYNLGSINGNMRVGGIIGCAQDGHTIRNCYNAGSVNAESGSAEMGGVIAYVTDQNTIENCYYNSDLIQNGVANGHCVLFGKTTEEMKDPAFLAALGEGFKDDRYDLVNNGYPLLNWQKTDDADLIDEVIEKINSIGTVTLESEEKINAAREAYSALDDELKGHVENYSVLQQAEAALAKLKADAALVKDVTDKINAIGTVTLESEEKINTAREAYDALSDELKARVENYNVLEEAEAALAKLQADAELVRDVTEKIDAIGTVTLASEEKINAAREAYDALPDELKNRVENYNVLVDAEAKLAELKDEAETPEDPPVTQDDANLYVYISLMTVGCLALVVLMAQKKKYM